MAAADHDSGFNWAMSPHPRKARTVYVCRTLTRYCKEGQTHHSHFPMATRNYRSDCPVYLADNYASRQFLAQKVSRQPSRSLSTYFARSLIYLVRISCYLGKLGEAIWASAPVPW